MVMWQHRHYYAIVISGLALPMVLGYWHGGAIGAIGCFMLAGMFRMFMVLNSTFSINSL
jgi:stearoyl-CoA desaturase (delta-9 desaturase)